MTRVILDVDGVCAEFVAPLLKQLSSKLQPSDITQWDMFALMPDEERARAFDLLKTEEFWVSQIPVEGAIQGVADLRAMGCDIIFATAPWKSCKTWAETRKEWLKHWFAVDRKDIVIIERKEVIAGDYFLDDKAESVIAWQRAHSRGVAYMYDAPYNQHVLWPGRFKWGQVLV